MCMPDKSRDAWPDAIADDDASILWFCEKQFSTKEPQDSPRESQCVKRIFPLERKCN